MLLLYRKPKLDEVFAVTRSAVTVPFGAAAALAVTVVPLLTQAALSNCSLYVSRFVLCSSTSNPLAASVTGSKSNLGPYTAALVVGV